MSYDLAVVDIDGPEDVGRVHEIFVEWAKTEGRDQLPTPRLEAFFDDLRRGSISSFAWAVWPPIPPTGRVCYGCFRFIPLTMWMEWRFLSLAERHGLVFYNPQFYQVVVPERLGGSARNYRAK